ncbi:DeoR/GlpR family DNA-binding transcription regulator [Jannaschia seohaensis]|uniref:DeoR family glycerol-3-phosphate regulon repressor n=1 Tax=Jannaschia seohaensis TaxID=475081 RepID=A0A2Y9C197_9RHOB|nr:DeoR/GlpR family DNA-binding transcription regulator [Jannaschia seohaensis]PWJ17483.1 DeoR family glycerol-3-phosphate regulon repressor [Jannaschia seohaensis]SSA47572.1 DeoR family transcriptional regulator, glycerol-3-phosphate regulon repressor [Jannaschia seohaensis]
MATNFRKAEILEQARRDGKVVVEHLARRFDVTVQTIRRDLSELSDAGKLERVHGGAVIPSGVVNLVYEERRRLNEEGKQVIAKACAADIPDGSSLFMNIGTTTEAVAHALRDHENLLVVTNNLNIANILSGNVGCEIVVAGGMLRRADGGLIGGFAADTVRQFKFDYAVIGCSALDRDGDLLDFDAQEIVVTQAALARARRVFAVVDHSKLDRKAPIAICGLADLDVLYTDGPLPSALQGIAKNRGTRVVETGPA